MIIILYICHKLRNTDSATRAPLHYSTKLKVHKKYRNKTTMETGKRHTIKLSKESAVPPVTLQVSQPDPILPPGLSAKPQFISSSDANRLVEFFDSNSHLWHNKGFEKRRREQRYDLQKKDGNGNGTFPELDWIMERIHQQMNSDSDDDDAPGSSSLYEAPNEVIVEERYPKAFIKGEKSPRLSAATFENLPFLETSTCPCCTISNINHDESANGARTCSCYIAQVNLLNKCIQFIDKPKHRRVECWDVESQRHKYNFIVEPNTLVVKKGEFLWNWRSRLAAYSSRNERGDSKCSLEENASESESPTNASANENTNANANNDNNALNEEEDGANRIITIKFRRAVQLKSLCSSKEEEKKENDENELMELLKGKPLEELLTIIVTTSPIKSNPSTEVLERTFATFHHGGRGFAFKCPKVIICDGCKVLGNSDASNRNLVSKKYCNAKQSLRNGIATNEQAENYEGFKIALTKICKDAEEDGDSPFHNTR